MIGTKKDTTQIKLMKVIELGDKLTQVNAESNRLKARVKVNARDNQQPKRTYGINARAIKSEKKMTKAVVITSEDLKQFGNFKIVDLEE